MTSGGVVDYGDRVKTRLAATLLFLPLLELLLLGVAGCGGAAPALGPPVATTTGAATGAAQTPVALAPAMIALGAPDHATAFGQPVAFDGVAEGLYWPALEKAYAAHRQGEGRAPTVVVIAAPRDARTLDVLRAVWTLRASQVEVQTLGAGTEVHPLALAARPAARPDAPTCHAAAFVDAEGRLRVALPGGSVSVKGTSDLTRALAAGARTCTVRWVGVGAESSAEAWGNVFDVAWAVQASGAAPGARLVLAQPMRAREAR